MRWRRCKRRTLYLPVLVMLGGLAYGSAVALADSPLSWSAPISIDPQPPQPELDAVSCPSASLCVAVDRFGGIVSSGGPSIEPSVWSLTQAGSQTYNVDAPCNAVELCLLGVSCPSQTMCVAVGEHGQVLVSSDPGGGVKAWTRSEVDGGHSLLGISCPTTGLCVAVDNAGDVLSSTDPGGGAGAWTAAPIAESVLRGVSCSSASLCAAVDQSGDVAVSQDPTGGAGSWTVSHRVNTPLLGVSCTETGATLCAAVGGNGDVVASSEPVAGSWVTANRVDGASTAIVGVSCPSASLCIAADGAGNILSSTDPTGGAGAWSPSHVDGDESLYGVSCASEALCVAVTGHGDVLSSSRPLSGTWASAHVDSNDPARLVDVSCSTRSLCATVDDAENMITTEDPLAGLWSATDKLPGSAWGVTCVNTSLCIAGSAFSMLASVDPTAVQSWYTTEEVVAPIAQPTPHWAPHLRASCPSVSLCVAVEAEGNVLSSTDPTARPEAGHPTWGPASENSVFPPYEGPDEAENRVDPVFGVSCPSTSFCAAVDSHGYVSMSTDPAQHEQPWVATRIDGETPLEDIACPSVSLCVAVDEKGDVLSANEPAGGSGAWHLASVDVGHAITSVSCPSQSLCVAVDDVGRVLTSTDPAGGADTWTVSDVDPGHEVTPLHAFTSVSCVPEGLCVAVDDAGYAVTGTFRRVPVIIRSRAEAEAVGGQSEDASSSTPPSPLPGAVIAGFRILSVETGRDGRIVVKLNTPTAGSITARATTSAASVARRARRGKPTHKTAYGAGYAHTPLGEGVTTLTIKPTRDALGILKSSHTLRVPVTIVFRPQGGSPTRDSRTVTVRYGRPQLPRAG